MNIQTLKNKKIVLFGKSRAFSSEEFESQLLCQNITLQREYDEDVALVVEGKMITPYEQIKSDELYARKCVEFVDIDVFEKELACGLDEETLLMSLKLSHDTTRLKSFLQNSMISNTLFLKLLKMYAWGGEDFFENNDNRDVSAALIVRFYENIERNHNVQYATLGFMHLITQTKETSLIEAIAALAPLQKSLNGDAKDANFSIITAIATHYLTPKALLETLIKKSNSYVRTLIAMRADCDVMMQKSLYESEDVAVRESLSHNVQLDKSIAKIMRNTPVHAKNIAKYIHLDEELFGMLVENYAKELAQNEHITVAMQNTLLEINREDIRLALASNSTIDAAVVAKLIHAGREDIDFAICANASTPSENLEAAFRNKKNHLALSCNINTPQNILTQLQKSESMRVLEGLAKNPSTPIDVLYQLQLDARLERHVKENPSFGKHIMSENIGWLV